MGLFDTFKRNKTPATPAVVQNAQPTIAPDHISKKKKNTYTITFNVLCQLELFCMCRNTPLPVITLNGQSQGTDTGWLSSKEFPNPCATRMVTNQHLLAKALGTKISTQIIEYLDKETGKPIIQVYPDSIHIFDGYEENYMQHLNHASRRDLAKQIALREKLINDFIEKQQSQQR